MLAAILGAPAEAVLLSFAPLEAADQTGKVKIIFRHGMPPFGQSGQVGEGAVTVETYSSKHRFSAADPLSIASPARSGASCQRPALILKL